jgi:predicted nucleic acid-binding protein
MDKIFLDTNIVLDFLGERAGFYESVAKILTLADKKKIEVFTSPTSIGNTFYVLAKYENAKVALEKIRKFKLLSSISVMDEEVVEKAINSDFKDFEDAMQYYSALSANCNILITRNEKDFKHSMIPIMNAESYLQTVKRKNR